MGDPVYDLAGRAGNAVGIGGTGAAHVVNPAIESTSELTVRPWPTGTRLAGSALLAGWVLLVLAAVFTGERSSSLAALKDAVARGEVDVVGVSGGSTDDVGGRGIWALELHWREGLLAHHAEVREARPLRAAPFDGDVHVVRAGVVDRLVASQPDLRVVTVPSGSSSPFEGTVLGWRLPGWLAWATAALFLATLGLLIAGPQPWRATRWAWLWILSVATPLGVLAYLVLGGPTALSRPPSARSRRLTGGWSFVLAFIVSSALGTIANAMS